MTLTAAGWLARYVNNARWYRSSPLHFAKNRQRSRFVKEARGTEVSRILRGSAFDIIVIGATANLLLPIKASAAPIIPLASFTSVAITKGKVRS